MRETRILMGMPITVDVGGASSGELIETVFGYFEHIDRRFSTYRADSEITAINRGDVPVANWSGEMTEVFALALREQPQVRRSALQPICFFPVGAEICAQGEKAGAFYQIEFGAVRVYRLLADRPRQIRASHLAGRGVRLQSYCDDGLAKGVSRLRSSAVPNALRWFRT